jgi:ribose 5-phosphate isomerase A
VDVEAARRAAGTAAVPLVTEGMRVGLGTGTTAHWFIVGLAERVRAGLTIRAVATSQASADLAAAHGIAVEELGADGLDIAVDGADSVDPALRLIKGRGGAMVREKIVAASAARFVVIVDDSKPSTVLHGRIPVEVIPFGSSRTVRALTDRTGLGFTLRAGSDGNLFQTDNGDYVADSDEADIVDPEALARAIETTPGCAGHGLFLGMAALVIVGHADGTVDLLTAR